MILSELSLTNKMNNKKYFQQHHEAVSVYNYYRQTLSWATAVVYVSVGVGSGS